MKRSEMLDRIEFLIDDLYWQRRSENDIAEDILTSIEAAGMLPPLRKSTPDDFVNIGFTQDFLEEHDFKTNGWEDEDEKK